MADAEDKKQKQETKDGKEDGKKKKSLIGRLLPLIIMIVVVGLCGGAGFGLGKILAGTGESNPADEGENNGETKTEKVDFGSESDKFWYYDLEPAVVANLNEPGVTRYVSASLTLQMNMTNEKETRVFLDEKTPILRNWLYIFLSSLSISNIQGDKNLKSIQSQICDGFNKELFPHSKPQIKQVLIREFPIQ
ncbi:MAG: flagellar basal body-associated FliL family protein [Sedimentisphaerales bacterium]|nr:flagellar basal body-associated FliL family protein [Sedimentisphaerales bacterium]